jgi:hypothetical protein
MLTLITSCNRHDLLIKTIDSLLLNQNHKLAIAINEDSQNVCSIPYLPGAMINTYKLGGIGQHRSIETFIHAASKNKACKYYLHVEDDWEFENNYDWIRESIKIMEADSKVIKVLCRKDSPHPCTYDKGDKIKYGYLEPWENEGIKWHGFSWNPGITRLHLLNKFMPFGKYEQDLAKDIFEAGYKVVQLENGVYKHIGNDRSTH